MIDFIITALILAGIVIGGAWGLGYGSIIKLWLSQHGVMIATGDEAMVFPEASAQPTKAIIMKMFGVEIRSIFVGGFKTTELRKSALAPTPAPKIIVPE